MKLIIFGFHFNNFTYLYDGTILAFKINTLIGILIRN